MTKEIIRVGIAVPTIRESQILAFLQAWGPIWANQTEAHIRVSLFIHEDHPTKTFKIAALKGLDVMHSCHADIEELLGDRKWIIPLRSGACRSFPMYLAWKDGCDYIITMDDDCLPTSGDGELFLTRHLAAFQQDRWFRTIDGVDPRGVPYGDRGSLPVLLNHGLWTGTPDLDGPTSLVQMREPREVTLRACREVIPPGMWFTLCAMNVCYHRDTIPIAYNLLMGLNVYGLDRFDDIWSGLLIKRIADHLGFYVTNGIPFVYHAKASNYFMNLQKEALGIRLHEFLWKHVSETPFKNEKTLSECFGTLSDWIKEFPAHYPGLEEHADYFDQLGKAMKVWSSLFNGEGSTR